MMFHICKFQSDKSVRETGYMKKLPISGIKNNIMHLLYNKLGNTRTKVLLNSYGKYLVF